MDSTLDPVSFDTLEVLVVFSSLCNVARFTEPGHSFRMRKFCHVARLTCVKPLLVIFNHDRVNRSVPSMIYNEETMGNI